MLHHEGNCATEWEEVRAKTQKVYNNVHQTRVSSYRMTSTATCSCVRWTRLNTSNQTRTFFRRTRMQADKRLLSHLIKVQTGMSRCHIFWFLTTQYHSPQQGFLRLRCCINDEQGGNWMFWGKFGQIEPQKKKQHCSTHPHHPRSAAKLSRIGQQLSQRGATTARAMVQ